MAPFQPQPPLLHGLCDDSTGLYINGQPFPAGPCPNPNPNSGIQRDRCHLAQSHPHLHAPAPNPDFRVCDTCHTNNRINRGGLLWADLDEMRAIMCKKCSKKLKRQHPNGLANACTCRDDICRQRTCFNCMNRKEGVVMQRGAALRERLLYTHKVKDPKTKRRRLTVEQPGVGVVPRKREACPTQGCGEKPWVRT